MTAQEPEDVDYVSHAAFLQYVAAKPAVPAATTGRFPRDPSGELARIQSDILGLIQATDVGLDDGLPLVDGQQSVVAYVNRPPNT